MALDPAVDLALLPYSSGTTGLPKGVMLTHRACVANVLQQREVLPFHASDRVLAVAPFFHAIGFGVVANGTLHGGGTVVTMPRFEIEAFLGLIEQYRITAMVRGAADRAGAGQAPRGRPVRPVLAALAGLRRRPAGRRAAAGVRRRLGCPVLQGYGMTELTAAIAVWPLAHRSRPARRASCCRACRPGSSTSSPAPTWARARPASCGCAARR